MYNEYGQLCIETKEIGLLDILKIQFLQSETTVVDNLEQNLMERYFALPKKYMQNISQFGVTGNLELEIQNQNMFYFPKKSIQNISQFGKKLSKVKPKVHENKLINYLYYLICYCVTSVFMTTRNKLLQTILFFISYISCGN